jgi:uncharacterized protein YndB with AHSA1/START domain
MITIQLQIEIEAPPEIVFDLLADHTQQPAWHPYITEGRLFTEGPIRAGAKGSTVGVFQGRKIENEIVYHEYDRPRSVSGGTTSGNVLAQMDIEFIPTAGGTKIDYRLVVGFKGLMRLIEPFMKPALTRQYQTALEALKDYIANEVRPQEIGS